jgi:hypothetical protein
VFSQCLIGLQDMERLKYYSVSYRARFSACWTATRCAQWRCRESHISCVHTVWSSANSHDIFMLKSTLLRCFYARMAHLSLHTPTHHRQDVFCLVACPIRACVYRNNFDFFKAISVSPKVYHFGNYLDAMMLFADQNKRLFSFHFNYKWQFECL